MHIYELSYQNHFHYVSAWQDSAYLDVNRDGCGCLPQWALALYRTSHAQLMNFPIKS